MTEKPRILVVDDEIGIREMLVEYFQMQGFETADAADGLAVRAMVPEFRPDLILLDLNMPGETGLSLARWLRDTSSAGIIMLTGAHSTVDRVVGLEMGADDYVAKPCDLRELLARARSVLRRRNVSHNPPSPPAGTARIRMGRCVLELDKRRLVDPEGTEVRLTSMEFDLLAAFAANPDRPLDRDTLLELAHHKRWEPFDRSIDIRIARLRRKIESDPSKPQILRTVRGAGYMFVPGKA